MQAALIFSSVAIGADERAIIEAAVRYRHLEPTDKTNALSDKSSPLALFLRKPNPNDPFDSRTFEMIDTDAHTRFTISDELIDSLRARNVKSVSIKRLITSTKGRRRDRVSRPGISADGLSNPVRAARQLRRKHWSFRHGKRMVRT